MHEFPSDQQALSNRKGRRSFRRPFVSLPIEQDRPYYELTMCRKRGSQLLGILLFLSSLECLAQKTQNRQQEIDSHTRQAQKFLQENRPDLAISEFRAIVALDPKNVDALGNLGVLLVFQGNYRDALSPL